MAWDFEDACRDLTIMSYSDGASFSRDSSSCGMIKYRIVTSSVCAYLERFFALLAYKIHIRIENGQDTI